MIEKNELGDDDNTRVRIISEKKKLLQDTSAKVQDEVKLCFEQLAKVLKTREQQLLRQVQAVHNQQMSMLQTNWDFLSSIALIQVNLSEQKELERSILNFGELLSSDRKSIIVSDAEPYKIEEYVEANRDHISFDKSIKLPSDEANVGDADERLNGSWESPCETSLNASSEADMTLENEITVIMNENYSSTSDGLKNDSHLSELFAETKKSDFIENKYKEDFFNDSGNTMDNKCTQELRILDDDFGTSQNSAVPDESKNSVLKENYSFLKENEISLTDVKNNFRDVADQVLEKNDDITLNVKTQDCEEHPKQIQQWLQQILVETETEPTIHEIEQFAEISKSRFKEFQFPLET